ncbi:MAG: hypothetical protein CVU97_01195 [Firmicutes bacterium HGW-Firmicutes-21]|nr:MAG: hypothetical protein CVU97_01195 [Firmicutes bacterium HGW-Firmicutes-21]
MNRDPYKKRLLKALFLIFILGFLYYTVFSLIGEFPKCLLRSVTGFYCPGCGATSVFLSLLKGDFVSAYLSNAALTLLIPVWFVFCLGYYFNVPKFLRRATVIYTLLFISVGVLLAFFVLRNCVS